MSRTFEVWPPPLRQQLPDLPLAPPRSVSLALRRLLHLDCPSVMLVRPEPELEPFLQPAVEGLAGVEVVARAAVGGVGGQCGDLNRSCRDKGAHSLKKAFATCRRSK